MKNLKHFVLVFGITAFFVYLLIIGKSFLAPFVIGIIVWYVIITLASEYEHIKFKKGFMPHWLALTLSIITCIGVVWVIVTIVNANIAQVLDESQTYGNRVLLKVQNLYERFGAEPPASLGELLSLFNFSGFISSIGNIFRTGTGFVGLVIIYVLLLLFEYRTFEMKLKALVPDQDRREEVSLFIRQITHDVKVYVKIKTFVSLLTGVISYVILTTIGVDFAAFWALLIFLLNYIPTVGSIIAVLFPVMLTLIQFDSLVPFVVAFILLTGTQIAIGNILEPRLMGKSLNLSPLVIILSLGLWGKIWGVTGMFLCVPITVILNIVLSKFKATRPISIILSARGSVAKLKKSTRRKKFSQNL